MEEAMDREILHHCMRVELIMKKLMDMEFVEITCQEMNLKLLISMDLPFPPWQLTFKARLLILI